MEKWTCFADIGRDQRPSAIACLHERLVTQGFYGELHREGLSIYTSPFSWLFVNGIDKFIDVCFFSVEMMAL